MPYWEPYLVYGDLKTIKAALPDYCQSPTNKEYLKHPCPKPQAVMARIINSGEFSLILDPFLGSGTTAFCAKKLNRKCIGIEIEEKYCEIAAKRCSQVVFDFTPTNTGSAEPEIYQFMLDNKDKAKVMKDIHL